MSATTTQPSSPSELTHGTGLSEGSEPSTPRDWRQAPLGILCCFANGANADKSAYGKGVPFINVLEVITRSHLRAADIPGRVLLSDARRETFAVRRGDLLFNRTSETLEEVGLAAVYDDDEAVVFGGFVIRGRFIVDVFDATYVGYAFRAPIVRSQIITQGQGAIRANIGQANLKRVIVPIPSKVEQRAIAEVLSDVDGLIGALEALIAKKRAIKQTAMQQLLTGKTRLPAFSGEWDRKPLGDVAQVKTGPFGSALHEDDYVPNGTPIITVEHLGERGVVHTNLPRVSDADRRRLCTYSLVTGDIVFSRVGSIDRNALIRSTEDGWLFSGRLLRVRPDRKRVWSPYLSHQFHSEGVRNRVREVAVGQTMASLNTRILQGVEVFIPSLPEQTAIASVLSDMDAEIAALEARRAKTRAIKQGMMQQLLTGRVRLVKPATAETSA